MSGYPNRTITGKFASAGPIDNVISAYYSFDSGYLHIKSTYPLKSNISIKYSSRGTWEAYDEVEPGRWEWVSQDFEDDVMNTTFKPGESSWKLSVGWGFSAPIIRINWYIQFSEFSDSYYNYKKGIITGDDSN